MTTTTERLAAQVAEVADERMTVWRRRFRVVYRRTVRGAARAESAADRADMRARDADRIIRWGVALILAAVLAIFLRAEQNAGAVRAELAGVRAGLADLLERLTD